MLFVALLVPLTPTGAQPGRQGTPQLTPADPTLELASRSILSDDTDVFSGTGESTYATVSGTGRFVAFASTASDLTIDDYPNEDQLNVFLYDRETDEVTLLSRSGTATDTAGNGESFAPIIAADASRVLFLTSAPDVAGQDLGILGNRTLVVYDRNDDTITPLTRDHDDPTKWSCGDLVLADVSASGRTVATLGCGGNIADLDRATGSSGRDLTIFPNLNEASPIVLTTAMQDDERRRTAGVTTARLSADGSTVVYDSADPTFADAQHDANGTTGGDWQLYASAIGPAPSTSIVSADPATNRALAQGDTLFSGAVLIPQEHLAVDADGSHVAFAATMAQPFGTTSPAPTPSEQVYLRARDEMTLASVTPDGAPGNGDSHSPGLGEFGVVMAFASTATDLTRTVQVPDQTSRVHSRSGDFTEVVAVGARPRVSPDGQHVAFVSVDDGVVPGDRGDGGPPNSSLDLFLHDRHARSTRLVTLPGTPGDRRNPLPGSNPLPGFTSIAFSADSGSLAFTTFHDDLVGQDLNDQEDTFVVSVASQAPTRTPVTVQAIEVTQGVQDWRNSVDLITGRRTWVRVHATSDGDAFRTTGQLRGVDFQTGTELGRIGPSFGEPPGTAFLTATPDRNRLRNTMLFELPDSWTQVRSILLRFSIDGRTVTCADLDADCTVVTTLAPQATLPVQLVGVQVTDANSGDSVRPDDETMMRARDQILRTLPVSDPLITHPFDYVPLIGASPGDDSGSTRLSLMMKFVRWRYGCKGPQPDDCIVAGIVGPASLNSGTSSVVGVAALGGDAMWAQVDSANGTTLGHELGHILSRRHTASDNRGVCSADESRTDSDYPYAGGRLADPTTGPLDVAWGTDVYLRMGRPNHVFNLFEPLGTGDLMSYCVARWASDHTWAATADEIFNRFPLPAARQTVARQADQPVLSVEVVADQTGAWTLANLRSLTGQVLVPPPDGTTPVEIRTLDAQGLVLGSTDLMIPLVEEDEPVGVFATVPRPEGTAAVVVLGDGQEVARRTASPTPPSVRITEVGQADGNVVVRWAVDDPDPAAAITSDVEYSTDDGATWQPIALAADATTALIGIDAIPGSDTARVRVVSSDGFHAGEATSEVFVVAAKPPSIIVTPAPATTAEGQTVRLEAFARDNEDGILTGPSVQWTSDVDGALGGGTDLEVANLSVGRHTLTATATDRDGETANGTTTTLVLGAAPVRLAGPTRLETAVEISRASYADGAAGAVVLARADDFADTLAGTPLAVRVDGPILLSSREGLSAPTAAEIGRVLPEGGTVHLLGGTAALDEQVAADLTALGYVVERHAGSTRFETAVRVAEAIEGPVEVVLAHGGGFAEALVAASLAGAVDGIVLLTDGDRMPEPTRAALEQRSGLPVTAVGALAATAAPNATPISGSTPADTAVAVAGARYTEPVSVGVASAEDFPDALGAALHLARQHAPLLLTDQAVLAPATDAHIRGLADPPLFRWLYGGTAALSTDVEAALAP